MWLGPRSHYGAQHGFCSCPIPLAAQSDRTSLYRVSGASWRTCGGRYKWWWFLGGQSLRWEVLETKAVQGCGGAFFMCQRPDEGRESARVPTGSRKAFFSAMPVLWSCWVSHEDWSVLSFPGTPSFLKRCVMRWRGRAAHQTKPFSPLCSWPLCLDFRASGLALLKPPPPDLLHSPSAHVRPEYEAWL